MSKKKGLRGKRFSEFAEFANRCLCAPKYVGELTKVTLIFLNELHFLCCAITINFSTRGASCCCLFSATYFCLKVFNIEAKQHLYAENKKVNFVHNFPETNTPIQESNRQDSASEDGITSCVDEITTENKANCCYYCPIEAAKDNVQ